MINQRHHDLLDKLRSKEENWVSYVTLNKLSMFSKVYVLKYKNIKDKLNSKQASTTAGYSTYDIYYTLIMGVILINF